MCRRRRRRRQARRELVTLAAGALRGRPEPSAPPAAPPVEVERLLGPYQDDDDHSSVVRVEWRDGQLTLVGERDADVLVATGDALVWTVRSGRLAGEAASFLADDQGVVTGLNVAGYPYRRLRAERGGRREPSHRCFESRCAHQ